MGPIYNDCNENKEQKRNRLLAAVVERSDAIIAVKDPDLRVIAANSAFARVAGYSSPDELVGRTDAEIYAIPPDVEPVRTYMEDERKAQTLAPGERILREEPFVTVSGETRHALTEKYPIHDKSGRLVATCSISQDITERKRTEERLRESEERFRSLNEDLPVMVCEFLEDGTLTYVNREYADYFRTTPEELVGRPFLDLLPEEARDAARRNYLSLTPRAPSTCYVHKAIHPDGELRWHEWRDRAFFDEDGRALFFRGVGSDITERRRAEEELLLARKRAEAASAAKSEFLAAMSHEIRTPMNGVLGMTELLLDTSLDAKQRRLAATILKSAESLLDILNGILDLSKIEAGKMELQSLDFDLAALLEDLGAATSASAGRKGLAFRCFIAPDVPLFLKGDPGRLRQILVNLAGNAIKFTREGEVRVDVSLVERHDRGDGTVPLRFSVRDTGIGIPPDKIPSLFDKFMQVDDFSARQYGGTGLGLPISKQFVELMGGTIGVETWIPRLLYLGWRLDPEAGVQLSLLPRYLAEIRVLSGGFEFFDHIQLVQKLTQSMLLVEQLLPHRLVDLRQIRQRDELNEELALQVLLRRDRRPPKVQPLLQIPERLLYQILASIDPQRLAALLHIVGDKREAAEVLLRLLDRLLLRSQANSSNGRLSDIVVRRVELLVSRNALAGAKLSLQTVQHGVEFDSVLHASSFVPEEVKIYPLLPGFLFSAALHRLGVTPSRAPAQTVDFVLRIVAGALRQLRPLLVKHLLHPVERTPDRHQELAVIAIEFVNVLLAVEPLVHDQLHLLRPQEVDLAQQSAHRRHVGDVPRQLPVVDRQTRFLAVQKQQVDLRKRIVILVVAVLHLLDQLRVRRDRRGVVDQKLLLHPPIRLHAKKALLRILVDRSEYFAAPLRGDVGAERMTVRLRPFRETTQRIAVLQNQVVGEREDLLVRFGEALLQIPGHSGPLSDGVEEVRRTVEEARERSRRRGDFIFLLRFLKSHSELVLFIGHENSVDHFSYIVAITGRILLLLVPPWEVIVNTFDTVDQLRSSRHSFHLRHGYIIYLCQEVCKLNFSVIPRLQVDS